MVLFDLFKNKKPAFTCKYTYRISRISENDRWIHIECNEEDSILKYEPFAELVKAITKKWNNNEFQGNIISTGKMQYRINNDPYNLIYQWDDLFGIVIDYINVSDLKRLKTFLLEEYGIE